MSCAPPQSTMPALGSRSTHCPSASPSRFVLPRPVDVDHRPAFTIITDRSLARCHTIATLDGRPPWAAND